MKITISVTQDDIRRGQGGHCSLCPVALAISRTLRLTDISVGSQDMDLGQGLEFCLMNTPAEVARFIRDFDQKRKVKPFDFDLDVPDELVPAGAP